MTMTGIAVSSRMKEAPALAWALARTPLLLLLMLGFANPLLAAIERVFDIVWITEFSISVLSTPFTRFMAVAAAGLAFFAIGRLATLRGGALAYLGSLVACTALVWGVSLATGSGEKIVAVTVALLATNWAPLSLLSRLGLSERRLRALVQVPPAVGEVLFASRYFGWLRALLCRTEYAIAERPAVAPGAALAALAFAVLLNGDALAQYERALRADDAVRVVDAGNFNGLALDASGRRLFATGHGVDRVRIYDTADLGAPPRVSVVSTGGAQGLAYDERREEIHIFNTQTRMLMTLDATTLALKRTVPAPELSPGDPWVAVEPISDTIIIASEADQQTGAPIVILDRSSGAPIARRAEEAGNLLVHPAQPILYMSFFRRERGVLAYNLARRAIVARGETDERMDRLAYDPTADEVLVASPVAGEVLRFDADTLIQQGRFDAVFGVRVIAVDPERGVLLAGSLVTGEVVALDLGDHRRLAAWYLGPWLRSIVVAPGRGVAYVSSQGMLYELDYASSRR